MQFFFFECGLIRLKQQIFDELIQAKAEQLVFFFVKIFFYAFFWRAASFFLAWVLCA